MAGLAAALDLKDRGSQVEVFERSRLLGGRATSFEIDGCEVDNGQHVFLACCTEFVAFARRVGMEAALRLQERFDALVLSRDGRSGRLRSGLLPAPLHLSASFLAFPLLNAAAKLRVARALARALRVGASSNGRVDTFEEWLRDAGQQLPERTAFWDPFFVPALNAPFDRVAAGDALFVLRTAFLGDAGAARFGFSTVPLAHFAEAAARELDAAHRSRAVTAVRASDDAVELHMLDGTMERFDAVVLAVPPNALGRLLGDPAAYGVHDLDAFEPYPILDVHLWHDAGALGFDFAAALESPLQWIFEKSPGYLCCSFSAADEYMRRPTSDLETLAWREAQAFLPALRGARLVRSAVTRNPDATYLPRLGTRRPPQRTAVRSVAIAGAWTDTGWPDTMESAVRSGRAAAAALASPTTSAQ